jgi:excisionase family DNA binding protein
VAGHEWIGGAVSDSMLSELMTTAQVAELLQMKRTTVEDYARRGLLPSLKLGRHRRFVRSDVEAALVRLRDQHPPDPPR